MIGFVVTVVVIVFAMGCALMGRAPEPLTAGRHFVVTDTRAKTMASCARLIGIPSHTCTYRRNGDTIPTVYISIEDVGPVYRHELDHVAQDERGEEMNHKGWVRKP